MKRKDLNIIKKAKRPSRYQPFSYERFSISLVWIGVVITVIVFGFLFLDMFYLHVLSDQQDARLGNLGQFLEGTVGAIWALAGIILYYEALRFQRMELKSQRHEFELNRQEVIEQTQQFRAQNQTMFIQTFENTFFQLISLHNEIVSSFALTSGSSSQKEIKGRACFHEFYNMFKYIYTDNIDMTGMSNPTPEEMLEMIKESYRSFYNKYQETLGHYLRNIQNIIRFVDRSEIKNKKFYARLMHDHLTNYELLLLFYHCLSDEGIMLKPLVEKYEFMGNILIEEMLDRRHKDLYEPEAFVVGG